MDLYKSVTLNSTRTTTDRVGLNPPQREKGQSPPTHILTFFCFYKLNLCAKQSHPTDPKPHQTQSTHKGNISCRIERHRNILDTDNPPHDSRTHTQSQLYNKQSCSTLGGVTCSVFRAGGGGGGLILPSQGLLLDLSEPLQERVQENKHPQDGTSKRGTKGTAAFQKSSL